MREVAPAVKDSAGRERMWGQLATQRVRRYRKDVGSTGRTKGAPVGDYRSHCVIVRVRTQV